MFLNNQIEEKKFEIIKHYKNKIKHCMIISQLDMLAKEVIEKIEKEKETEIVGVYHKLLQNNFALKMYQLQ